jgi:hypothetical protein
MKRPFIISFIFFALLGFDCERENKSDCFNVFCSKEFKILNILIKHSSDTSAVILTTYKVLRVLDNKDITHINDEYFEKMGYYPLADDNDKEMLRNRNVEIEFQGYVENTLKVKERFVVTADCCHVYRVTGKSEVYI